MSAVTAHCSWRRGQSRPPLVENPWVSQGDLSSGQQKLGIRDLVCAHRRTVPGCREINKLSLVRGGGDPSTGLHLPASTGHLGIRNRSAPEANVPEPAASQSRICSLVQGDKRKTAAQGSFPAAGIGFQLQ